MVTKIEGLRRVMIVDDEPMILSVGRRILVHFGLEVLSADDGTTALEMYRKATEKIDLVILDLAMPIMDGAECFRGLKQIDPEVKAVVSSGNMEDCDVASLLEEGVLAVLPKPYNMQQLTAVFAQIFSSSPRIAGV